LHSGQLSALGIGYRHHIDHITVGLFIITTHFVLERGLDGAYDVILPRLEIAREFGLERLPNAACRQLLSRADGGANTLRDCGLENLVRYCWVDW
jgi:hypothetical protein